jgi:NAD(P)-dependent dehydrogenase (short-subunit alcohol dehydrogenase family)
MSVYALCLRDSRGPQRDRKCSYAPDYFSFSKRAALEARSSTRDAEGSAAALFPGRPPSFWIENQWRCGGIDEALGRREELVMDLELEGKRALVTGSTAGIGLAIAQELAKEGAAVVVNGRTAARVTEAVRLVRASSGRADVRGIAADLGTAAGCTALLGELPDVDVLVNNLGIFEAKPFDAISDEDWLRFFEVNVLSGVRLSRAYLPRMLARNWGRIQFISSESALQIPVEMIQYGMTKTAQLALARGLAEMTAGSAVTVNAILPGPTKSEGVAGFVSSLAEQQGKTAADVERDFFLHARPTSLLRRFETTEEIAALVAFVASPRASGINGAALRVDGGVVRAIG